MATTSTKSAVTEYGETLVLFVDGTIFAQAVTRLWVEATTKGCPADTSSTTPVTTIVPSRTPSGPSVKTLRVPNPVVLAAQNEVGKTFLVLGHDGGE